MFRRITPITTLLLTVIIVFVFVLFHLYEKFSIEKKYTFYQTHFIELRILEKDFNIFLLNPVGFLDYDKITAKQKKFDMLLSELENCDISLVYDYDFTSDLKIIHEKYSKVSDILEYQKSLHSMTISKTSYLFDLHKTISESPLISDVQKKQTNEVIFTLIQFLNGLMNTKSIEKKINDLSGNEKFKNLNRFYQHSKNLFDDIKKLSLLPEEYLHIELQKSIEDEMLQLNKLNSIEVKYLQNLILVFSSLIAILMIILLILHHISLRYQESLRITASVFENMDEGILIMDIDKKIIDINKAITDIFDYTKEECLGMEAQMLQLNMYSENFYNKVWRELSQTGSWKGKINDITKDGTVVPSWLSINVVKNKHDEVTNYIVIHRDLSAIIKSQERVDFLAYHDSLTKLPNRINFEEHLLSSMEYAKENSRVVVILFIDLDRFKIINDSLGHDVGDRLLEEVSKRLKNSIREIDSLARIGGDEFVVTLDNLDYDFDASQIARKILSTLSQAFKIENHVLNTSASIGIAQYPKDATDAISLVKYADSAMYDAKANGKNCFRFFTDTLANDIDAKLEIEQALRKALESNELYLNFQPQYLLKSKKIIAVESLLRWNSTQLGMIEPNEFIPIAEESGLIKDIGYFVFRESCAFMKELQDKGIFLDQIAINVSAQQFEEQDIVEQFLKIVDEYDLTSNLIEIEITEHYAMESRSSKFNILDTLKEKGFKISIDDFGTGYSSLRYLKQLPLNTLKIDKSFIDDVAKNSSDVAIVKSITTLTNSLEYHCVAEGIETLEQELLLEQKGCDIGQGYYFSKPLGKKECVAFIVSHY